MSKEMILVCDGCGQEIAPGAAYFSALTVTDPNGTVHDHLDLHPEPSCWQAWGNKVWSNIPAPTSTPPPLQVHLVTPAADATADPSSVSIQFNEVIVANTAVVTAKNVTQNLDLSVGAMTYDQGVSTLHITLVGTWATGDTIQVTLAKSVTNLVDVGLAADYTWTFTAA